MSVRLLANENVPGAAVVALRHQGHDVAWMREDSPGSGDRQVLERAQREGRILVTFDKDFGELVFRQGVAASAGIILFRITLSSPEQAARAAVAAFASGTDWIGHFAVIEDDRIRLRALPNRSPDTR